MQLKSNWLQIRGGWGCSSEAN